MLKIHQIVGLKAYQTLAAVVVFFAMTTSANAEDSKIAVVDIRKAVQATSSGKKARTDLEGEFNKRKKELEKKEGDLKKMREDLEKKRSVLSEEVLAKRQGEFQEEMAKFQDTVAKNQMEIRKKEQDLMAPILDKMKSAIEKVATEKGITVVLQRAEETLPWSEQGVVWAAKNTDITDAVIAQFEKENKK
ncbi:MAG: OmpH family outer membrane protein [Pseudobdellovibrionaceae bacterium]